MIPTKKKLMEEILLRIPAKLVGFTTGTRNMLVIVQVLPHLFQAGRQTFFISG